MCYILIVMKKFIPKGRSGFTLIEILIVLVIIAVLGSLAIPRYTGQTEKARVAEAVSILSAMRRGQVVYYNDHGEYYAGILSPLAGGSQQNSGWGNLGMEPPVSSYWMFGSDCSESTEPCQNGGTAVAVRTSLSAPAGAANSVIQLTSDGTWSGSGPYAQGREYAPSK